MKIYAWSFVIFVTFIYSCTSDKKPPFAETHDSIASKPVDKPILDSLPWNTIYNEQTHELVLKHHVSDMTGVGQEEIIKALNKKYPDIQMEFVSAKGDTVITRIKDALQLTQNIGTAGAETYMAEATYSLTEIPTIKEVTFEFEVGDHAMPGTYNRADFKNFK
ncbi:hypothetical protein [Arcticibacter eurypsychrophilus]|uniref:hypothetical protein n=1 Tax=Arcticibacter eurypsychrophilus TaxID=1434752 RepID=UPI00084DFEBC|nr:hypothetical protein [Arcticibacter eurypsychrophilus]